VKAERARELYYEMIIPYFERDFFNEGSAFLHFRENTNPIKRLINDGVNSVFNPHSTVSYWNTIDSHFGIARCIDDIKRNYIKGWDGFKRDD
jgi:hypothetical protein